MTFALAPLAALALPLALHAAPAEHGRHVRAAGGAAAIETDPFPFQAAAAPRHLPAQVRRRLWADSGCVLDR
jgi:hypothetical protein